MANMLINYVLNKEDVANLDGSFPINFTGVAVVAGPGATPLGDLNKALSFGTTGRGVLELGDMDIDRKRFALRVVFQASGAVTGRQNLIESNKLPFAMFLLPGANAGEMILQTTVSPKAHGWSGPNTRFGEVLKPGIWYTADLVYDIDTLGVFVDEEIVSVHAFPQGGIDFFPDNQLFIGSWVDGARNQFSGAIAAIQWFADIPEELESKLDERRSHPEWFTSYKYELIKPRENLGAAQTAPVFNAETGAYLQTYDAGGIMYHDGIGMAFELHGAIWQFYRGFADKSALGYLVTDETNATQAGGRKNTFSRGAIYWSPATGAVPVTGQIYLDYEHVGESRAIGFPTQQATSVSGGLEQIFQGGRMYHRTGATNAFVVRGLILAKFLSSGGIGTWGYPITHETDLRNTAGAPIGKFSEFEHCTIYWSEPTGAFEVHGDICRKYKDLSGPAGTLGFPITDEGAIPGAAGAARYSGFQNGSILWFGSFSSIVVARPFRLFLGRVDTKESEGAFMGQNDLYLRVTVKVGNALVYNQRHPNSGDISDRNVHDFDINIPAVIVPNSPSKNVVFGVDVWESDGGAPFGGGDDHLGVYSHELNMANGWGLGGPGIFNSGSFSTINNISWSIKPDVDPHALSETEKFWGVSNRRTDTISKGQYAAAFRDVDSETEWWDVTDWLQKAFYELVVKSIASGGNCFGMALEAICARKNMSLLGLPINRFTNWNDVVNEFNIKHCYQVGAGPIWWFLGEFITGNTHDPKEVFENTRREFNRGNHPVLSIAQNYDFSGGPHCILPVAWDSSSKPWSITICDPNFPNQLKTLTVDPDNNTYDYAGSRNYSGGAWSGGRLHYMPFCLLNSPVRTPVWDAILLLLGGTILILGDDSETTTLTDIAGNDLDGFGQRATEMLKASRTLDNFFVQMKGYGPDEDDALIRHDLRDDMWHAMFARRPRPKGTVPGELFMRRAPQTRFQATSPRFDATASTHLPISALLGDTRLAGVMNEVRRQPTVLRAIRNRSVHHVLNDANAMARLTPALQEMLKEVARGTGSADFKHTTRGVRNGTFAYALKKQLSEMRIQTDIQNGESQTVSASDFGTTKSIVKVTVPRDKRATVQFAFKLGVDKDELKVRIEGLPVQAGKELSINARPGLGGIDLVGTTEEAAAGLVIEAKLGGRSFVRRSNLPMAGGVRLKISQALTESAVNVSTIDRVFGPVLRTRRIRVD